MAQDYHIYLHDRFNSENHTKPFERKEEGAFKSSTTKMESESETGASALKKVGATVALATAIYKTTEKVLTIGFAHLTEYTGHYEYEMGFNNFKTTINHIFNPIGLLKQTIHRDMQFRKENQRIAEEAKLIGKTIYSDWKIGV